MGTKVIVIIASENRQYNLVLNVSGTTQSLTGSKSVKRLHLQFLFLSINEIESRDPIGFGWGKIESPALKKMEKMPSNHLYPYSAK